MRAASNTSTTRLDTPAPPAPGVMPDLSGYQNWVRRLEDRASQAGQVQNPPT